MKSWREKKISSSLLLFSLADSLVERSLLIHDIVFKLFPFQLSQVKEYMRYRKLPLRMRLKVEEYYEHRFHHKLFDEDIILNELSKALREVHPS